ncbi:ribosomal protein S12 methylthiotransferase [Lachnospiraceae bacterium XPB1003]|nr:ribosomal protein S12 methylthiotransferase [Lachnospiraceae bacterium XPB1003]
MENNKTQKNIMLISLGCDKNLVDSEMMLGMLSEAGYKLVDDEGEADVIVVNTCCFINDAKEESIQTLIDCGNLKSESGRLRFLVAAGCLAQRYADEIRKELPEVDAIIGTTAFDKVVETINGLYEADENGTMSAPTAKDSAVAGGDPSAGDRGAVSDKGFCKKLEPLDRLVSGRPRILSTGGYYAYLKIAEGCNKNCSYCIIPKIRGPYRSVPIGTLLEEAKKLSDGGVKELILVAQETTIYGTDIYGHKALPELLERLSKECDFNWIRILYGYPEEIDKELIEQIAVNDKVCHYLDLPIQHSADSVLKRMGRRTSHADLVSIIGQLRDRIPDIALRTTLITGFPGETEEDFEELKEFVKEMRFDRLGVFAYSPEEGTAAEKMADQIPEEVKASRRDEIMEIQQEIAFEKAEAMCGREIDCMVCGRIPEDNVLVCRSYMDAPDVDGYVFVDTDSDIMSGTALKIRITGAKEYDLTGEII